MEKLKIIADHREIPSGVVKRLFEAGVEVETKQLEVGDYIVSTEVGVERKSTKDFVQSILDRRLMEQVRLLKESFPRPLLILEGEDLFTVRGVHPNAIRGALLAVAVDFGVPILWSRDEGDTAALLLVLAKREQLEKERPIAVRGERKGLTLEEKQRYLVEGLPGVSAVLAQRLLEHFGTVEGVMKASEKELQQVRGIGEEKAREIREVLTAPYPKSQQKRLEP